MLLHYHDKSGAPVCEKAPPLSKFVVGNYPLFRDEPLDNWWEAETWTLRSLKQKTEWLKMGTKKEGYKHGWKIESQPWNMTRPLLKGVSKEDRWDDKDFLETATGTVLGPDSTCRKRKRALCLEHTPKKQVSRARREDIDNECLTPPSEERPQSQLRLLETPTSSSKLLSHTICVAVPTTPDARGYQTTPLKDQVCQPSPVLNISPPLVLPRSQNSGTSASLFRSSAVTFSPSTVELDWSRLYHGLEVGIPTTAVILVNAIRGFYPAHFPRLRFKSISVLVIARGKKDQACCPNTELASLIYSRHLGQWRDFVLRTGPAGYIGERHFPATCIPGIPTPSSKTVTLPGFATTKDARQAYLVFIILYGNTVFGWARGGSWAQSVIGCQQTLLVKFQDTTNTGILLVQQSSEIYVHLYHEASTTTDAKYHGSAIPPGDVTNVPVSFSFEGASSISQGTVSGFISGKPWGSSWQDRWEITLSDNRVLRIDSHHLQRLLSAPENGDIPTIPKSAIHGARKSTRSR